MDALVPFEAILGTENTQGNAFILTISSQGSHLPETESEKSVHDEVVPYVFLMHRQDVLGDGREDSSSSKAVVTGLYRLVANCKNEPKGSLLFSLLRISPLEFELMPPEDPYITLNHRRNKQNILLSYDCANLCPVIMRNMLTRAKGMEISQDVVLKCMDFSSGCSNRILFGTKMDADIFERSLEFHSEFLLDQSNDSNCSTRVADIENEGANPSVGKSTIKERRQRSSVVISLRRISSAESYDALAYKVVGMKGPATKKRKGSNTEKSDAPPSIVDTSEFYFIVPEDFLNLTDYYVLLYSQVKRGVMCDRNMANRKNAACLNCEVGFLGLGCRHCGGKERGSYFPSSCKNLQACPPTLHSHLLKCASCPDIIKRCLKLTKTKHKYDMISKPPGAQLMFYHQFWKRVQDPSFDGVANAKAVLQRLHLIEKHCTYITDYAAEEFEPACHDRNEVMPTIVNYDEMENGCLVPLALSDDKASVLGINTAGNFDLGVVTKEDFELALQVLRRPSTPNSQINLQNDLPEVDITPEPVQTIRVPIAVRMSDIAQCSPDGFNSTQDGVPVQNQEPAPSPIKTRCAQENKMRKFARNDEALLVRGMLVHGKKWKRIWEAEPLLQHIKHSALKDRARSRRFNDIQVRVEEDPSLLENPEALCGSEDQPEYTEDEIHSVCLSRNISPYRMNISELLDNEDDNDKLYVHRIPVRYVASVPIENLVNRSPSVNKAN